MMPKSINNLFKNQPKNSSDFEAENESKMAPKMSPGAPRERPKTRPKKKRKIIEKKVMQVTQGHAPFPAELGRGGGFPLNPAGAPPTGAY